MDGAIMRYLIALIFIFTGSATIADTCSETISVGNPWSSATNDSWGGNCTSTHRTYNNDPYAPPQEAFANYYTFTLDRDADIRIDINSGSYDYNRRLYLIEGDDEYTSPFYETYDGTYETRLSAGTYTLEISHIYGGSFSYKVSYNDVGLSNKCELALTPGVQLVDGWIPQCESTSRDINDPYNTIPAEGHRARYLTFSLAEDADISLNVDATTNSHIYLLEGTGEHATPLAEFSAETFSTHLTAGDYTFELTTYDRYAPGQFSVLLNTYVGSGECVQDINIGDNISGTWSADCAIRSWLDGNGDPYQGDGPERAKYYEFTLDEATELKFTRSGISDNKTVMSLYLSGDYQNKITTTQPLYYWGSTSSEMSARLEAGTYQLEVTKYNEVAYGSFQVTTTVYGANGCTNQISLGEQKETLLSSGCLSEFRVFDGIDDPYGAQSGIYYAKRFEFTLDETQIVNLGADTGSHSGYVYLAKIVNGESLLITDTQPENYWSTTRYPSITRELGAGTYVFEVTSYYPEKEGIIQAHLYTSSTDVCDAYLPLNTKKHSYLGSNTNCRSEFKDPVYNYDPYGPNNGTQYFYAKAYTFEVTQGGQYQIKGQSSAVDLHLYLVNSGDTKGDVLYEQPTYSSENNFTYFLQPGIYTIEVTSRYVGYRGDYSILVWDGISEIVSTSDTACSQNINLNSGLFEDSSSWQYGCNADYSSYLAKFYEFDIATATHIALSNDSAASHWLQLEYWNGYNWHVIRSTTGSYYSYDDSGQYVGSRYKSTLSSQLETGHYRVVLYTSSYNGNTTFDLTIGKDSDGDGYYDSQDDFPHNPEEWLDTDGDNIGNNADMDDDNDGIYDYQDFSPLVAYIASDNDPYVDIYFGDITFSETEIAIDENSGHAAITLNRTPNSIFDEVDVYYYLIDDSAIANQDYTPINGTIHFDSTNNSATINVPLINDDSYTGTRSFHIELTRTNASLSKGSRAKITINDDDIPSSAAGVFSFTQSSIKANESDGTVTIEITRQEQLEGQAAIYLQSLDGSARAFNDYDPVSSLITFAAGEASKTVSIGLVNNTSYEASEYFSLGLTLIEGDAIADSRPLIVNIIDDDDTPAAGAIRLTLDSMYIPEGGPYQIDLNTNRFSQVPDIRFALERIAGNGSPVQIMWSTQQNTAIAGEDFVADRGIINFEADDTHKSIGLSLLRNYGFQALNKSFCVNLSIISGDALLEDDQFCITLYDMDSAPENGFIQFSGRQYTIKEGNEGLITLNRLFDNNGELNIQLYSEDLSAQAGSDYERVLKTITFSDQESSKTIALKTLSDSFSEGNEQLLINATQNGMKNTVPIIIQDDASIPTGAFRFSGFEYPVKETDESVSIVVQRVYGSIGEATLTVTTSDGSAKAPGNYTSSTFDVTFANGDTSKIVEIPINNDGKTTGTINFNIHLLSQEDVALITPSTAQVAILDAGSSSNDGLFGLGMLHPIWLMFIAIFMARRRFTRK